MQIILNNNAIEAYSIVFSIVNELITELISQFFSFSWFCAVQPVLCPLHFDHLHQHGALQTGQRSVSLHSVDVRRSKAPARGAGDNGHAVRAVDVAGQTDYHHAKTK